MRVEYWSKKGELHQIAREKLCSILVENTRSFYAQWDWDEDRILLDPNYVKYIQIDWTKIDLEDRKDLERIIFRPDINSFKELICNKGRLKDGKKTANIRLYTDSHTYEWFRITATRLEKMDGNSNHVFLVFSYVEHEMNAMITAQQMDVRDRLTGLASFASFVEQTEKMLNEHPESEFAFVRMDIDRFRQLNQSYGTKEGNGILRFIAVKIQECVELEGYNTYCHMINDIFYLCISGGKKRVEEVVDYLQNEVNAYPISFELIISFGVYLLTKEERKIQVSVTTAMDRAWLAQNTIKQSYMKHIAYYDEHIKNQEEHEEFVRSEMTKALDNGEFQVYYQPKCDISSGRIVGSEALVRWIHPERGRISPIEFVPVFEKNGFVMELDYYILNQVCKCMRKQLDEGKMPVQVSVNLSRIDLNDPYLLDRVVGCVDAYQIPHELISFELTESAYIMDSIKLYNLSSKLQKLSFEVLMDDFGSGYSSLNSLKELNVDTLKIDIKFMPINKEDEKAKIILRAVVEMANALGMKVIAEGVENIEQAEFLLSIGCVEAQGFYFYQPLDEEEYEQCLKKQGNL